MGEVFAAGLFLPAGQRDRGRTALITDPEARAKVDIEMAAQVVRVGALSVAKTELPSMTGWIAMTRAAVRRAGKQGPGPVFRLIHHDDGNGTSSVEGTLLAHDAAALDHAWRRWPPRCATPIRAPAISAAPTRWVRWVRRRPAACRLRARGLAAAAGARPRRWCM